MRSRRARGRGRSGGSRACAGWPRPGRPAAVHRSGLRRAGLRCSRGRSGWHPGCRSSGGTAGSSGGPKLSGLIPCVRPDLEQGAGMERGSSGIRGGGGGRGGDRPGQDRNQGGGGGQAVAGRGSVWQDDSRGRPGAHVRIPATLHPRRVGIVRPLRRDAAGTRAGDTGSHRAHHPRRYGRLFADMSRRYRRAVPSRGFSSRVRWPAPAGLLAARPRRDATAPRSTAAPPTGRPWRGQTPARQGPGTGRGGPYRRIARASTAVMTLDAMPVDGRAATAL
jgi:hypothetical protein